MWNLRRRRLDEVQDPQRHFEVSLKRSRPGAWWDAWRAVRAWVPLQEYLEARLGIYRREAPQIRRPLPFQVDIRDGTVVLEPVADQDPRLRLLADPAGVREEDDEEDFAEERAALQALSRSRTQSVMRDLREKEDQVGRYTDRLRDVRDDLEERKAELTEKVSAGAVPVAATRRRAAEERGKPLPEASWKRPLGWALMVGFVMAETFQYFAIVADATGAVGQGIGWQMGAAGFAALLAVATVVLPKWIFSRMFKVFSEGASRWRKLATGAGILFLGGIYTALTVGLGLLRHAGSGDATDLSAVIQGSGVAIAAPGASGAVFAGAETSTAPDIWWIWPVINFAAPITLALLWQWVVEEPQARRRRQRELRWQWNMAQSERIESGERLEAIIAQLEAEEAILEQARQSAREELERIAAEAQAAEEQVRAFLEMERRIGVAWVQALQAALQLDRLEFVQRARRSERPCLLKENNGNSQEAIPGHNGNPPKEAVVLIPEKEDGS